MMAEREDEDDFPNDFDGLDFDGIAVLQAPTVSRRTPEVSAPSVMTSSTTPLAPTTAASPIPSAVSDSVEDMDSSFLAAVDELEARVLGEMARGNEHPRSEPLGGRHHANTASGSLTRSKPDGHCLTSGQAFNSPPGGFSSATRKGKEKALQEDTTIRAILAGYESELTCPICCDLLVGAQVANPCGHTCCGECGYQWLAQNKYEPTCAVCRTNLYKPKPLLPNFSADNLVRQHLQALAKSGRPEWQDKGYRAVEWNKRLESWKNVDAREKAAAARLRRFQHYYEVDEYHWPENMDDDEEAPISHAMLRRRTRSRR